jgi:PAS domain S-box-containing protein
MGENECLYKQLFINNRAIMLLINPETSEILDCSFSACSFYGYSYAEMLKLKINDLNSLTEPQVVTEMNRDEAGQRNHFYFQHRLSDGQIRDVEVSSTPITLKGKELLCSIIWDITDSNVYGNKLKVENILLKRVVWERTKQLEETNELIFKQKVQMEAVLENMEKTVERSEAKYKELYYTMPLGHAQYKIMTNVDGKTIDYSITEVNPVYERITKLNRHEIIGRKAAEFLAGIKNLQVNWLGIFDEIMSAGKPISMETYSDTTNRWYDTLYYCPEPGYVASIFSDITDRKNNEVELKKAKEQLLEAQKFAHLGYWEINALSGEHLWSDELFRIFGFKPQEFIPTMNKFTKLIHPGDKELFFNALKDPSNGHEFKLDFRIITQDNETKWIHEKLKYEFNNSGKLVRRYGVVQDITQRKLSELKLKESEEKFKELAENLGEVIWIHEAEQIVYINSAFKKVFGRTCQSLYDNPHLSIDTIHPEDRERIVQAYKEVDYTAKYLYDEQYRIIRPDGTIRWVWARAFPICRENGKTMRSVGICDDITSIKEYEKSLSQAKEEAEAANAAKSQFLANMSHEIRTPINGVMGMLQLLQMTELTKEQVDYIKVSMTSADSLLRVINDILDYSKIEAGQLKIKKLKFDLAEFLNEIVVMFKPSVLKKGFALNMYIDDNVPNKLIGDSFRLRQVLSNLIGNAIKFTPKGRIDLIVRKLEECNNEVKLEWLVQDTGIGLSGEIIKTIFNSFNQADSSTTRQYGGTGLGLSICKGLVENMKGEIWVESKEGEGSNFYFTCVLEKSEEDAPSVTKVFNIEGCPTEDVLKLLIVEDDEVSRMVIEKFAKKKGWQVILAENGKEAIDCYREQRFNAVLMDVQIPILDGYKATGIIRQLDNKMGLHTPIIAITAHSLKEDREKCLEAGMDDYLSKPVNVNEFYRIVEKCMSNCKKVL